MSRSEVPSIPLPVLQSEMRAARGAMSPIVDEGPFLRPEGRVLATLEQDGRRRWIRPKQSPGAWWRRRRAVAWALIVVYAAVPWTTVDGMPTVLLDVVDRKFIFFGEVFRPTESLLFGLLFLSVFLGIFLLTALFGRVWCGWACPQTVYLEFVYRPIERLFLGKAADARARGEHRAPAWRRVAMYAAYTLVSAHLANTLLAWFVGADRLTDWIVRSSPFAHPVAFAVFAGVTLLMLLDFAFFREQLCSLVCPYGRFQSALLDRDSLTVGYDRVRGEPRGKGGPRQALRTPAGHAADACSGACGCDGKGGCGSGHACDRVGKHALAEPTAAAPAMLDGGERRGDCIDCTLCVQTCPAGIDIRDGLQLECVQCTQCIDACDAVMTRLGKPTGLIRYSSQRELEPGCASAGTPARRGVRMRLVVYPLLLAVVLSAAAVLLARREDAAVAMLRTQGIPYTVVGHGDAARVESVVRMRIDNRRREARAFVVEAGSGVELAQVARVEVAGDSSMEADVVVRSAVGGFVRGRREAALVVREESRDGNGAGFRREIEATVLGPLVVRRTEKGSTP